MRYFLLAILCLFPAGDLFGQKDLDAQIVAAWLDRYNDIRTAEYVVEGTEVITPDFLIGFATAPETFVVKQRPISILCRIDFTNRRVYLRQVYYEWQVHLERFLRVDRQVVWDEVEDRVQSYRKWSDTELNDVATKRSDSRSLAQSCLRPIEVFPLWFNSGILFDVGHSCSLFTFPQYGADAQTQWTVTPSERHEQIHKTAQIEVRNVQRPTLYRLELDEAAGYLPIRYVAIINRCSVLEVNVSYIRNEACYVANKWESTVFSTKHRLERSVSLSLTSCSLNKPLRTDAFELQVDAD